MEKTGGLSIWRLAIPVGTKLPDIARHVIESKFIGPELFNEFVMVVKVFVCRESHISWVIATGIEISL